MAEVSLSGTTRSILNENLIFNSVKKIVAWELITLLAIERKKNNLYIKTGYILALTNAPELIFIDQSICSQPRQRAFILYL